MKTILVYITSALVLVLGVGAGIALASNPHGEPPGQGECSHGATGKECKPDPQPEHGKDCEEHGNHGGVNEDHCKGEDTTTTPTDTTPTDTTPTTPTDTTPTTPTETTPTEPTPTTPETPGHDCVFVGADKDGGVDAYGGTNDDCAPFPPSTTTTATVNSAPTPTTAQETPVAPAPKVLAKTKAKKVEKKTTKKVKILKVSKPNKYGVVKMKLSDGRTVSGYMGQG